MVLLDSHCHLQAKIFSGNLSQILHRSQIAGVTHWVVCGTEPGDWDDVVKLLENTGVIPGFGVHPWYIPDGISDTWIGILENLVRKYSKAVVGEVGLDRTSQIDLIRQEEVFIPQLELAVRYNRPVSIHGRKTWDRVRLALKNHTKGLVPGVMHSFNGTKEDIKQLLSVNAYFSFSGALTRTHNQRLPETLKAVPFDRLLIETDSPDLLPLERYLEDQTKPNEPSFMLSTFYRMADLLGVEKETLANQLLENSRKVFLS